MSKYVLAFAALVLVVLGGLAIRSFAADDVVPQVGQTAPTFTLPSQEGTPVSLDSYKGKWVVLYFYPKDMTSGCTREAHEFQNDLEKYKAANAVILGVSVDSVDSHKQFCTKDSLSFTLLSDADKKVVADYGSLGNYMGMQDRETQYVPHRSQRQDRKSVDRCRSRPCQRRSTHGSRRPPETLIRSSPSTPDGFRRRYSRRKKARLNAGLFCLPR